jgi:uncharacterized protein with HEPN domain
LPDRQSDYLRHIDEATGAAKRLAGSHSYESSCQDDIAVAAMERFIERISEASQRVAPALKDRHPHVPWSDVAGIGNIIRHDYDEVDHSILWHIATVELDPLEAAVRALLTDLGSGNSGRE